LLAAPVESRELLAPQIDEVALQATLTFNPFTYGRRIRRGDSSRCRCGSCNAPVSVNIRWRVETQNGPLRYAYPIARYNFEHKCASGVTRAVNDNLLAGLPHLREEIDI